MSGWKIGALALVVMGCLFLLVELQSPSRVLWTGTHAKGYSEHGIIYYRYRGTVYTLDNSKQAASDPARIPATVYFDPKDPSDGDPHTVTRWIDAGLIGVWFVGAAAVLLAEFVHRQRLRRRPRPPAFGDRVRLRIVR